MKPIKFSFRVLSLLLVLCSTSGYAMENSWKSLLSEEQRQQPVSLNTDKMPLSQLIQLLADQHQLNILIADQVSGESSLKLNKVAWQDAFDTLLTSHGLTVHTQGSMLRIDVADDAAVDNSQHRSILLSVNFAKASDLASLLKMNSKAFCHPTERSVLMSALIPSLFGTRRSSWPPFVS